MTEEIELKLEIDPAALDQLASLPPFRDRSVGRQQIVSVYHDTDAHALAAAGLSLRVREIGGRFVQTVKRGPDGAGLFVRAEWECDLADAQPVADDRAGPLADAVDGAGLRPIFRTVVTRTTHLVERDGGVVECAIDRGAVVAAGRTQPIGELELELKRGLPATLFAVAREVADEVPVRLGVLSKSARGYRLVAGATAKAVKAEPPALRKGLSAATLFQAIARSCLLQFRLNEQLLGAADNGDALHQAHVGLRRLRSAFSLFKPLLAGDPEFDRLRDGLRDLASTLGKARDLDVLAQDALGTEARATVRRARRAAYAEVHAVLEGAPARGLLLDLAEWLALGGWLVAPVRAGRRDEPARAAAERILARFRKRLKRDGKHLAKLDDAARHEVRIEAKKLRYATEFFVGLVPGKARERHARFLQAVEQLQDRLGELNDDATAAATMTRLGLAPAAAAPDRRAHQLARAEAAYRELIEAKRFWR